MSYMNEILGWLHNLTGWIIGAAIVAFIVWMEKVNPQPKKRPRRIYLAKDGTSYHPDDLAVDEFARKMKTKLRVCREIKGRSGWDDKEKCSNESLTQSLMTHAYKGDPLDVANFCMFIEQRSETIDKNSIGILTPSEQRAIMKDPSGIIALINHHMMCELEADSVEPGLGSYHTERQRILNQQALDIINQDPDCFDEHVLNFFKINPPTKHPTQEWVDSSAILMMRLMRALTKSGVEKENVDLMTATVDKVVNRPGNRSLHIEEERY